MCLPSQPKAFNCNGCSLPALAFVTHFLVLPPTEKFFFKCFPTPISRDKEGMSGRRRTRPLELCEHESVDNEKPLDLELLLDEKEYRLKWPSAPLSKLLTEQQQQQQQNRLSYGGGLVSSPAAVGRKAAARASSSGSGGRVVVPPVLVGSGVSDDGSISATFGTRRPPLLASALLPPDTRWTGDPTTLFVFSQRQAEELLHTGFLASVSNVGSQDDLNGSRLPHWCGADHPAWFDAMLWITFLEERAHLECAGKALSVLRMLPLGQAVSLQSMTDAREALVGAAPAVKAWRGWLCEADAVLVYKLWLTWRQRTSSPTRPWGCALVASMRSSYPWDDFFLSQDASSVLASKGTTSEGGTTNVDVVPLTSTAALSDFGLRLKRDRRGNTANVVFGFLPFEVSSSRAWELQQASWSLLAIGRRIVPQPSVETLVEQLPDLRQVMLKSAPWSAMRKQQAAALDKFLDAELKDCEKLLSFGAPAVS